MCEWATPNSVPLVNHNKMARRAAASIRSITAFLLAVVSWEGVTALDGQPPASILINIEQPLTAGRRYEISCLTAGWEAPPNISWWLGDQLLPNSTEQVSADGNETMSTLLLTPTPDDHAQPLKCQVEGAQGLLEETIYLDVYFAPILELRSPLNKTIEEGSSVDFTCEIRANPIEYLNTWKYQGRLIEHNPCTGVRRSRENGATVYNIRRHEVGDYRCVAGNVEGETEGSPLLLDIIYKPDCRGPTERVYAVPRQESVSLVCDVDALPPVEGYRWTFNSTTSSGDFSSEWLGGRSQRNHTPVRDEDYGSFYCWARNALGEQAQPCVIHVVPPGKPEAPSGCSVTSWSPQSVEVKCAEVVDGVHRTDFLLEVFDVTSGKLLYNQTRPDAEFLVDNLTPRQRLHLRVTAFSVRGRSETVTLATTTLDDTVVDDEEREESSNCSVLNRTSQSLMMVCLGGFDNELTQSFLSEVVDSTASHLLTRTTQKHRTVMVNGLAIRHQRRMRMLADSFNGQIAAVMMDFPMYDQKQVTIVEPLSTRILLSEQWMVAGESVEVTCRTVGSQPPAYVTWWLDDQRLFDTTEQVSADGSETLSTVRLTPTRLDDRAMLTCRAENPYVPSSAQEHSIRLVVFYPPKVSLYVERPLRPDDIREGDNVTLKCQALSNPPTWKVKWDFQGRLLRETDSNGTLNETLSLSLNSINRTQAGDYSCVVSNAVGDTTSSPLRMTVKYKPVCRSQYPRVYAVPRREGVQLECQVDAVPQPDGYRWMFNSSMEADGITMSFLEWANGGARRAHKPVNDMDYGTFYCWGYNALGLQQEPCVFHVAPPGRPNAPSNCSVLNKTAHSFAVQCPIATDDGRRQSYQLQVFDVDMGFVKFNKTQLSPLFLVDGLRTNQPITMRIASVSPRGRSEWVRLAPPPTMRTEDPVTQEIKKKSWRNRHRHLRCGLRMRPCQPTNVPRL